MELTKLSASYFVPKHTHSPYQGVSTDAALHITQQALHNWRFGVNSRQVTKLFHHRIRTSFETYQPIIQRVSCVSFQSYSSRVVKLSNLWCTSTLTNILMLWCLIKHKEKFIITFMI
jgi:hypothetical protein